MKNTYFHTQLQSALPGTGLYQFFHHRMTEEDFFLSGNEAIEVFRNDPTVAMPWSLIDPPRVPDSIMLTGFPDFLRENIAFTFPPDSELYFLFSYHLRYCLHCSRLNKSHSHCSRPASHNHSHCFRPASHSHCSILTGVTVTAPVLLEPQSLFQSC